MCKDLFSGLKWHKKMKTASPPPFLQWMPFGIAPRQCPQAAGTELSSSGLLRLTADFLHILKMPLERDVDNGGCYAGVGAEYRGNLYLQLNFAINLKLL